MVFWAGILVGGFFAWFAIKIGFYETWAMLFNIVISIYIAVFLTPVIVDIIPAAGQTSYGSALTLATAAIGIFLILYGITYTFFTGQFSVSFPKIFDTCGAGVLGFLIGFLIWSFAALLISTTPISKNTFIEDIGFGSRIKQTNVPYISWWCDLVNSIVSAPDSKITSEQVINQLL
ncbi:MAG: CvpA family protein, partial [Planctomycetota bacterium]